MSIENSVEIPVGSTTAVPQPVPPGPSESMRVRRKERLRMLPMVATSYVVDTVLLCGFCLVGSLPWSVPPAFLGAGLLICGAFHVVLDSELPERLRDHHMVMEQMVANCAVLMAFLLWAPQVGVPLMMLSFVIFAFGALRMKFRSVVFGSTGLAIAMGLIVALFGDGVYLPIATPAQRAVSGLWFAVVLSRLAFLGQHGAHLRALLNEQRAKLTVALAEVERLASRDELTGARNRRAIMLLVSEEHERMKRNGVPFAVALFDIDSFKRVNDEHGHLVGDEVLRRFVLAAAAAIRVTDRLGRYGGEEFLLFMPTTDHVDAALAAAERVCEAVRSVAWASMDAGLDVTVSAGIGVARSGESVEALLGRADGALYAAKHAGRNCVRAG
jgi:diguanylate cyclase (GGDEF)-like protein